VPELTPPQRYGLRDRLRRGVHRMLALGGIRPPLELLLKLGQINPIPAVVEVPPARRVLVLAPHMDDETLGCGGAILLHRAAGAQVDVAFITDGSRGFLPSELAARTVAQRIAVRRAEAASACELLAVRQLHYLDLPDGRSRADDDALERLALMFSEADPDLVYLPFITDAHHDHRTANRLFDRLLAALPQWRNLLVCGYEVWTPLYPNAIVDISECMQNKLAALACYESQLRLNDYLGSVRGLNAYRAMANHGRGFAEAFFQTSARDYRQLLRLLDGE